MEDADFPPDTQTLGANWTKRASREPSTGAPSPLPGHRDIVQKLFWILLTIPGSLCVLVSFVFLHQNTWAWVLWFGPGLGFPAHAEMNPKMHQFVALGRRWPGGRRTGHWARALGMCSQSSAAGQQRHRRAPQAPPPPFPGSSYTSCPPTLRPQPASPGSRTRGASSRAITKFSLLLSQRLTFRLQLE